MEHDTRRPGGQTSALIQVGFQIGLQYQWAASSFHNLH